MDIGGSTPQYQNILVTGDVYSLITWTSCMMLVYKKMISGSVHRATDRGQERWGYIGGMGRLVGVQYYYCCCLSMNKRKRKRKTGKKRARIGIDLMSSITECNLSTGHKKKTNPLLLYGGKSYYR